MIFTTPAKQRADKIILPPIQFDKPFSEWIGASEQCVLQAKEQISIWKKHGLKIRIDTYCCYPEDKIQHGKIISAIKRLIPTLSIDESLIWAKSYQKLSSSQPKPWLMVVLSSTKPGKITDLSLADL